MGFNSGFKGLTCVNIETGRGSCGESADNVTSGNWIHSNERTQIRQSVCRSLAHALCKEYVIYTTKAWRLCKEPAATSRAFWTAK